MIDYEHQIQVQCVTWFRWQYRDGIIFAIPNGGLRDVRVARKLKAEGATAGVPDLCIPMPTEQYHGLFVEMKNGKQGRLSDAQKLMLEKLSNNGYKCVVCRSFDDFKKEIEEYFENVNKN